MRSKARLAGHPLHPMLVMFPVALLPLLLLLDVAHLVFAGGPFWEIGFWIASLGVVTTLVAMVPGIVDMAHIPDATRAHRTGVYHAILGTLILFVYAGSLAARWPVGSEPDRFWIAAGLDLLGMLLVTAQGYLGGELVYRHHVGVQTPEEGGEPVILLASPRESRTDRASREAARRRGAGRP